MLAADMQASCSYSSTLHEASHSNAFSPHTFSGRQHPLQSLSCKLFSTRQRRNRARNLLCRADSEGSSEAARWLRQLETGQKIGSEYGEVRKMVCRNIRDPLHYTAAFQGSQLVSLCRDTYNTDTQESLTG